MAYNSVMATVDVHELRQSAAQLILRVEAGEEFTVTVAGRPSARLVAAESRRWRPYDVIADLFDGPTDSEWHVHRDQLDQALRDPWTGT